MNFTMIGLREAICSSLLAKSAMVVGIVADIVMPFPFRCYLNASIIIFS